MNDEERERRAQAAQKRAAAQREATMLKERQYQAELAELDIAPESRRAIDYVNSQLLRPERSPDWQFLRDSRVIHLRQGTRLSVAVPVFEEDE